MPLYSSATIPTEPNTTKDFSISADWWNASFNYRQSITIEIDDGIAGTDYQVLVEVTYDSDMQVDFADLRFIDEDDLTLLDCWRESYTNSTSARFWVEIQEYMSENQDGSIYMYYGNSTVSTTSNGTATFLFFEDWASETLDAKWLEVESDGTLSYNSTPANHGSVLKIEGDSADTIRFESVYEGNTSVALRFRAHVEATAAATQRVAIGSGTLWGIATASASIWSDAGTHDFYSRDDDENNDLQTINGAYLDDYFTYEITRDGTNSKLFVDDTLRVTASCAPDVNNDNLVFLVVRDSEYDLYSDWILGRKFIASEPYVSAFGEEENNLIPEWELISSVEIIITIGVYSGGLNALVILLGIIMIPASTVYLAYSAKHEMSADKLFYGLIAFILGWGFLLGGIG